jgi:hypothetical protein
MAFVLIDTVYSENALLYAKIFENELEGRKYVARYYTSTLHVERGRRAHAGNLKKIKDAVKQQLADMERLESGATV